MTGISLPSASKCGPSPPTQITTVCKSLDGASGIRGGFQSPGVRALNGHWTCNVCFQAGSMVLLNFSKPAFDFGTSAAHLSRCACLSDTMN